MHYIIGYEYFRYFCVYRVFPFNGSVYGRANRIIWLINCDSVNGKTQIPGCFVIRNRSIRNLPARCFICAYGLYNSRFSIKGYYFRRTFSKSWIKH